MTSTARHRVRLDLDEREARALYAGLQEALKPRPPRRCAGHLSRLSKTVASWLDRAPISGEAGYLVAAASVLRVLVEAEDRGRHALTDDELGRALRAAKPAGVTIADVLTRMRRQKLVRSAAHHEATWWTAALAGRQLLAGYDGIAAGAEWTVTDAAGLAELIFREHSLGPAAFRPALQAIGRISDEVFE